MNHCVKILQHLATGAQYAKNVLLLNCAADAEK